MKSIYCSLICAASIFGLMIEHGFAWETSTHELMTDRAYFSVRNEIQTKLVSDAGIPESWFTSDITAFGRSMEINKWLMEGAFDEDAPDTRPLNHFHEPLLPYNQGFFTYLFGLVPLRESGNTSTLWMQLGLNNQYTYLLDRASDPIIRSLSFLHVLNTNLLPRDPDFHNMSWQNARSYYFKSLVAQTESERKDNLVKTYLALGHLVHLVQDATNPAHVRGDPHPPFINSDEFHYWLEHHPDRVLLATSLEPDPSILQQSFVENDPFGNPLPGLLPIARLIDNNLYNLPYPSPDETVSNLAGVSEFTSANFLSDDNMDPWDASVHPESPYPNGLDMVSNPDYVDTSTGRHYWRLSRPGLDISHFLLKSATAPSGGTLVSHGPVAFDDAVFSDYSEKLIPRAIGYSAALIKYFFRGSISIEVMGSEEINIKNSADEDMEGEFSLFYSATDGNTHPVPNASMSISLAVNQVYSGFHFTEPTDMSEPGKYLLVFKGRLGAETPPSSDWGAVVAKTFETISISKKYVLYRKCEDSPCFTCEGYPSFFGCRSRYGSLVYVNFSNGYVSLDFGLGNIFSQEFSKKISHPIVNGSMDYEEIAYAYNGNPSELHISLQFDSTLSTFLGSSYRSSSAGFSTTRCSIEGYSCDVPGTCEPYLGYCELTPWYCPFYQYECDPTNPRFCTPDCR